MPEEKKKRGRPSGSGKKKEVIVAPKREKPVILNGPVFDQGKLQKRINELTDYEPIEAEFVSNGDGSITVSDPILAAELSRSPRNADHENHTPFPSNWNEMGKIQKLEWLTANPRK